LRGSSYLASVSAAFHKQILSHLGLARASVISGDTAKARTANRLLRERPDSDIPILKEAKAEYAKVQ